jgi:hypothetical protein
MKTTTLLFGERLSNVVFNVLAPCAWLWNVTFTKHNTFLIEELLVKREVTHMNVRFENHLSLRVMELFFEGGCEFAQAAQISELKKLWMANLKTWHSPYTLLIDCRNVSVASTLQKDFLKLFEFFSKFFMRKCVGFADSPETAAVFLKQFSENENIFPFEVMASYELASASTGLGRTGSLTRNLNDLRSRIQIDNDFNAHVMEISLLAETQFETAEDIKTLQQKLQNILMQWHSPYSVLFRCDNVVFSEEARVAFAKLEKFLKAFFCQSIIGYAPKGEKNTYPFVTFRSRHLAAAELEHQGLQSGEVANCSTRKNLTV